MTSREANAALREFALKLPGAYEEFPWGERVIKVNKKIFLFMGLDAEIDKGVHFGVKLPNSHEDALIFDFVSPARYNLGKSGWVSIKFLADEDPPVDLFTRWIEESYRAIAPKKLIAQLKG
jgi:predicted DNA-binding protein (MmcQ/YjbR family)